MVHKFLERHGQSAENIDADSALCAFLQQMTAGLKGEKSSLAMTPTYLFEPDLSEKTCGKKIIIDAGGTNFRSASGFFDGEGKAVFGDIQRTGMPASDKPLSCENFYNAIAANVERLLEECGDIGFCFSYPVDMGPDRDGVVQTATKELKAEGIAGTKIGERTLKAIGALNAKKRDIVILNDTVATLLGGMAIAQKKYSAYIGYIYGTGTNIAYLERSENIIKARVGKTERRMVINTECGNFNGIPCGDYDKEVINATEQPDKYTFEKMTSGKYLATVMQRCLAGAEREGVFQREIKFAPFELKDVTEFLLGGDGGLHHMFGCGEDRESAKLMFRLLIERAAKMGAIANAAATVASGNGESPVAIVAEGTTFNKLPFFRREFEKYLNEILAKRSLKYEIIQGEELNMLGSLLATTA